MADPGAQRLQRCVRGVVRVDERVVKAVQNLRGR